MEAAEAYEPTAFEVRLSIMATDWFAEAFRGRADLTTYTCDT